MSRTDAWSMAERPDGAPLPVISAPRGGISYTPSVDLSARFTARGTTAAQVREDARRIAAQVFPDLEVTLTYEPLTPAFVQIDGSGQSRVDHWQVEVTARASVPDA